MLVCVGRIATDPVSQLHTLVTNGSVLMYIRSDRTDGKKAHAVVVDMRTYEISHQVPLDFWDPVAGVRERTPVLSRNFLSLPTSIDNMTGELLVEFEDEYCRNIVKINQVKYLPFILFPEVFSSAGNTVVLHRGHNDSHVYWKLKGEESFTKGPNVPGDLRSFSTLINDVLYTFVAEEILDPYKRWETHYLYTTSLVTGDVIRRDIKGDEAVGLGYRFRTYPTYPHIGLATFERHGNYVLVFDTTGYLWMLDLQSFTWRKRLDIHLLSNVEKKGIGYIVSLITDDNDTLYVNRGRKQDRAMDLFATSLSAGIPSLQALAMGVVHREREIRRIQEAQMDKENDKENRIVDF